MKRPPFAQGTLPNGLRWIHQQVASPAGHVGLVIQAGSRDESDPKDEGLAHFIEHMMFKGTTKRKAFHVLSRVESVGGELNAYTSKEDTSIYASFLKTHYSRAMELLMDVIQNATYPDKEIPKEQDVILDEIDAYKDQPAEMLFDGFDQLLFPDLPWDGISLEQSRPSSPSTERTSCDSRKLFTTRSAQFCRRLAASLPNDLNG